MNDLFKLLFPPYKKRAFVHKLCLGVAEPDSRVSRTTTKPLADSNCVDLRKENHPI